MAILRKLKSWVIEMLGGFQVVGRLRVFESVGDSKVRRLVLDKKNIVVNGGKLAVLHAITTGVTTQITKMAVGNGSDGSAAEVTDDELTTRVSIKDVDSVENDDVNIIGIFRCAYNSGDGDFGGIIPAEINEAALVLDDGTTLFSKKTFSGRPFIETNNTTLTFIWSIGVA